jgi:hypothetical protein
LWTLTKVCEPDALLNCVGRFFLGVEADLQRVGADLVDAQPRAEGEAQAEATVTLLVLRASLSAVDVMSG